MSFEFTSKFDYVSTGKEDYGPCSAYFPLLPRTMDKQKFIDVISECIGVPERIDWVEITPSKKDYISAFVHFICADRNAVNSGSVYIGYYGGFGFKFDIKVLPARNPIVPTTLNIHQIANNLKIAENTTNNLEKRISDLETIVANQEKLINKLLEHNTFPPPPILRRDLNTENVHIRPFPLIDFSNSLSSMEEGNLQRLSPQQFLLSDDGHSDDNLQSSYVVQASLTEGKSPKCKFMDKKTKLFKKIF
jgi:hypothetical protein